MRGDCIIAVGSTKSALDFCNEFKEAAKTEEKDNQRADREGDRAERGRGGAMAQAFPY